VRGLAVMGYSNKRGARSSSLILQIKKFSTQPFQVEVRVK
jgi:hypothetical protein